MSHKSQVIFQALVYLQVIFRAILYLAARYTNTAADNATIALLDAQQAMLLLEIILSECSLSPIKRQKLITIEVAYVDLELFIERLQTALDILTVNQIEYEMD